MITAVSERLMTDMSKARIDETATPVTAAMTASMTPAIQHSESKYEYDSDHTYDDDLDDDDSTMMVRSAIGMYCICCVCRYHQFLLVH
jgi:hypothetical protein